MAISGRIIVVLILFAVLLYALSEVISEDRKSVRDEGARKFLIFSRAYITGIGSYIVIYLIKDTSILRYILQIVIWYAYCSVLAATIIQFYIVFRSDKRWIRSCTSAMCYYALGAVLIELFFNRFTFISNETGIDFIPGVIPLPIFFFIPICVYYICVCYMLWEYRKTHNKPREKYLFKLAAIAIMPSLIGLLAEAVCHTVFQVSYPVFFILMIIPYKLMNDIHKKSRSFQLLEEDFEGILSADKTDVVFICDDEQTILYQNNAARINTQRFKDEYIGRKLTDVFTIDRDVERAMRSKEARNGLMVPALYPITENRLVMSVEYIYDCVDEILCSIITIPNYDVTNDAAIFLNKDTNSGSRDKDNKEDNMIPAVNEDSSVSITENLSIADNCNILLVDDDINRLGMYESFFKPYEITIDRAIGGRTAINKMLEPCYDAVFIFYDMDKLNGIETAKRIRGIGSDYYSDVPIIFILNCPVGSIYKDLLDVSFNDFIEMPISSRKLNTIMTRWLWRRYAITERADYDPVVLRIERYLDNIEKLCNDCINACRSGQTVLVPFMLKGMKRLCSKLEDKSLTGACDVLIEYDSRGEYDTLINSLTGLKDKINRLRDSEDLSIKS